MTYAPLIRIALRYLAAALVSFGALDADTALGLQSEAIVGNLDTIAIAAGALIGIGTELWYARTSAKTGAL